MKNQWADPKLSEVYVDKATNPTINWYEYSINVPDAFALIPANTQKLLDFGAGPGDVTHMLSEKYSLVEGCDSSPTMITAAKATFPEINFYTWDGMTDITDKASFYDTVFAKLSVHFVEDLPGFAKHVGSVMRGGGSIIISVPHPMSTIPKIGNEGYWEQVNYENQIGSYGISATFIHRSFQDYINAFVNNGYTLTAISEPEITPAQMEQFNVDTDYAKVPRRVNFRFQKSLN